MEPFIGQIMQVGFNFAPKGWMFCNGQLLSIAQNTALFSLLGTAYGGDGVTTFALPNLQSRSAIAMTTNASNLGGLSQIQQGEVSGLENVTLTQLNLPAHTHAATVSLSASSAAASATDPQGNVPAMGNSGDSRNPVDVSNYSAPSGANVNMAPNNVTVASAGANQPVSIRNPYIGMNFIIAVVGVYPSRS